MKRKRPVLLMLDRWIERAIRHMRPEFTSHDYLEKLRDVYPADYAHDLALCTIEHGFPQSLAVLHRAIAQKLRNSDRVESIGSKESRDIRGNTHPTLVWRRLDALRPPTPPRARPAASRKKADRQPRPPGLTAAQLRQARKELDWTKSELARRAGVSLAAVTRWEANERRMSWPASEAVGNAIAAARADKNPQGKPAARRKGQ